MAGLVLTEEQYKQIDTLVTGIAERNLVGVRVVATTPLASEGITEVGWDDLVDMSPARRDMAGDEENEDRVGTSRKTVLIPEHYKRWSLGDREMAAAADPAMGGFNRPLDLANATRAVRKVNESEDDLIFNGDTRLGIKGLTDVAGSTSFSSAATWPTAGAAYNAMAGATQALVGASMFGPGYVGVFHPTNYGHMLDVHANTGTPQLQNIRAVLPGGVWQTPILTVGTGLVLQPGREICDRLTSTDAPRTKKLQTMAGWKFKTYTYVGFRARMPAGICVVTNAGNS